MNALSLAKVWFQQCKDEHDFCGHFPSNSFGPTRLINPNSSHLRLHIVGATESDIQYATLSHCWGLTSYTVLKRSSLPQFLLAIPLDAISLMFQHVIMIAKYLGLRYIWIDLLCIIQDSVEDWEKEAALMGSVYGRSIINIAASGAKDGAVGCFFERKNSWICRLKIESEGCSSHFVCLPAKFYVRLLDGMPLMKRAWALQERVLPSRSLHFTQSQLFWECNELHACEALQYGYDYRNYGENTSLDFNDSLSTPMIWNGILSSYSRRSLTMGKDKLIAISGLAKLVQEKTQDMYIAGLWRFGLESQLCWYVASSDGLCPRPRQYKAPTWSWAAVHCRQVMPYRVTNSRHLLKRNYLSIEDVTVNTVSDDSFEEVLSANLVVRCDHLLHGVISVWNDITFQLTIDKTILTVYFSPDSADDALEEYYPDTDHASLEAYLFPVFESYDGTTEGLVLQATGAEKGQYQRLGTFYFHKEEHIAKFQEVLVSGQGKAEDLEYANVIIDSEGKVLRVIIIV